MKWIYIAFICFCCSTSLTAQDSLHKSNKTLQFVHKFKPMIGIGYKNQSILKSNGGGSYTILGLTFNKSYRLTFGSSLILATFGKYTLDNKPVVLDNFIVEQNYVGFTYILKQYRVLHPALYLNLTRSQFSPEEAPNFIKFRGLQPGVDLQLNLNRFFRFNMGIARNISIKNAASIENIQLNSTEFTFGMEFSRFKK